MLNFAGSRLIRWFAGSRSYDALALAGPSLPPEVFALSADQTQFFFGTLAGSDDVLISSSSEWTVTTYPAGGWCNLSKTTGLPSDSITIIVSKNLTGVERNCSFIVSLDSKPIYQAQIYVTQYEV